MGKNEKWERTKSGETDSKSRSVLSTSFAVCGKEDKSQVDVESEQRHGEECLTHTKNEQRKASCQNPSLLMGDGEPLSSPRATAWSRLWIQVPNERTD